MATDWLLCSYRLPREPSRLRLAIWRRVKRLGAILIHDALWALPADAKTREDFDWLAEEIEERGGSVMVWEARSASGLQDGEVIQRFRDDADQRYADLARAAARLLKTATRRPLTPARLESARQQLRLLERTLRSERRRDYFRASGRQATDAALRAAANALGIGIKTSTLTGRADAVGD
jgi:Protein ChrB, N-terminal